MCCGSFIFLYLCFFNLDVECTGWLTDNNDLRHLTVGVICSHKNLPVAIPTNAVRTGCDYTLLLPAALVVSNAPAPWVRLVAYR